MKAITYPNFLPNPTVDMSGTMEVPVTRVVMETGRSRQQLRYEAQNKTIRVAWELTTEERDQFDYFFRVFLRGGTLYFDLPVPAPGGGLTTIRARFIGGVYRETYRHYDMWLVRAEVEAVPTKLVTDADTLLLMVLQIWGDPQGCLDFSDLFHTVVHETVPANIPPML